jgi:hypothetical protein
LYAMYSGDSLRNVYGCTYTLNHSLQFDAVVFILGHMYVYILQSRMESCVGLFS